MSFCGHDIIGTVGVILTLLSYFLLQIAHLKIEDIAYSAINALGSIMILYSLYYESNFSAALMESMWLIISLYGVIKILLKRKQIKRSIELNHSQDID